MFDIATRKWLWTRQIGRRGCFPAPAGGRLTAATLTRFAVTLCRRHRLCGVLIDTGPDTSSSNLRSTHNGPADAAPTKNCPHFPVLWGILGESGPSLVTPKNILQTLSRSVHPFSTAHGCDLQTDGRAGKNLVFKEKNIKVFKCVTFWVFRYFKSFKFYIL